MVPFANNDSGVGICTYRGTGATLGVAECNGMSSGLHRNMLCGEMRMLFAVLPVSASPLFPLLKRKSILLERTIDPLSQAPRKRGKNTDTHTTPQPIKHVSLAVTPVSMSPHVMSYLCTRTQHVCFLCTRLPRAP